jgi:Thymidylate synthase
MIVLKVRNVHEALPQALAMLERRGIRRQSRNGPVLQSPEPVTTVYEKPLENVIFWPQRDANPFFHLYEALWMLQGRNDVAPLERYVKNSINYSDDGMTLHGAYGYRWRKGFGSGPCSTPHSDQLEMITEELISNPDSRRCVLQMWSMPEDLGRSGKDLPCNTIATFQRGFDGELNLVVFNRSNDIIWGCYGANAVQFSFLLEYMALWIGCPVGTYTQVSVNWHAYMNEMWDKCHSIRPDRMGFNYDPYAERRTEHVPISNWVEQIDTNPTYNVGNIDLIDGSIRQLLKMADEGKFPYDLPNLSNWEDMVYRILHAHHLYKINEGREKYTLALAELEKGDPKADWIVAAKEWIQRRFDIWWAKKNVLSGDLSHP